MAHKLYSIRKYEQDLKRLIDVLNDPLCWSRNPKEAGLATRDLIILLSDQERWDILFEVKPGCKSNRILKTLGPARMEWLIKFYEEEVQG